MLSILAALIGAAGYSGIHSTGHVVPKWLVIILIIYGMIVAIIWGMYIAGVKQAEKVSHKERIPEKDNVELQECEEMSLIKKAVAEQIVLKFYDKKKDVNLYSVQSISEKPISKGHILLIGLDSRVPQDVPLSGAYAPAMTKEHTEYFCKIEAFYCQMKEKGLGKTEKYNKWIYSKKQWNECIEKIKLVDFIGNN